MRRYIIEYLVHTQKKTNTKTQIHEMNEIKQMKQ